MGEIMFSYESWFKWVVYKVFVFVDFFIVF